MTKTPTVETRICDTNISFLIDTGASVNIIDYQSYRNVYPRPKLQPHSPMIYAYGSQSALPVIGNFSIQIIHKNANTTSTFYVVKTDSKLTHGNLLSGETAQKLGILQFALSSSMQANVTPMNVSEQFPKLFVDGVGKISDIKIKLHIDPSVQPVSQRHRRIPFHVRKDIEAELDRLEKLGIIEKVDSPTPWVSPIVVLLKANGGVRLCIDVPSKERNTSCPLSMISSQTLTAPRYLASWTCPMRIISLNLTKPVVRLQHLLHTLVFDVTSACCLE